MTAASDFMTSTNAATFDAPSRVSQKLFSRIVGCPLLRAASSFFGFTLMAASVGIWVVSGAVDDAQLMMFKLIVTFVFFVTGLTLSLTSRRRNSPEVHMDAERRELRVVDRGCDGIARHKATLAYDDMRSVDFQEGMMLVTGHDGEVMLELPMGMVDNLAELKKAMGPAFTAKA